MSVSGAANYGAFSVGTSAAVIVSAGQKTKSLIIKNTHASQTLFVGDDSSVSDTTGFPVAAGESISIEGYNGPVYGYGSGADTTGRYLAVA